MCGFAFTSFSADALHDMPYGDLPLLSVVFVLFAGSSMAAAVAAVCLASYVMLIAERLSLTTSVVIAIAAARKWTILVRASAVPDPVRVPSLCLCLPGVKDVHWQPHWLVRICCVPYVHR